MPLGTIEERMQQAAAVRELMFGPQPPAPAAAAGAAIPADFREMIQEWVFGSVWSRPGLELQQRSFIIMAVLTALGKEAELQIHVGIARRLGITEEQIQEMLIQISMYAGVPAAIEGFRSAGAAFAQFNEKG